MFFFSSRPTAAVVASAVGCGSSCGSGRCRLHHPTITVGADGLIGRGRRCAQAFPSWLALHPHSFVSTQQSNSKSSSQKSCFGSAPGAAAAQHSGGGSSRKHWRQRKTVGGSIGSDGSGAGGSAVQWQWQRRRLWWRKRQWPRKVAAAVAVE